MKDKCNGCWAKAVIDGSAHCAAPKCHKKDVPKTHPCAHGCDDLYPSYPLYRTERHIAPCPHARVPDDTGERQITAQEKP